MKLLFLSAFPNELQSLKDLLNNANRRIGTIDQLSYEYQSYQAHEIYFSYTGIGTAATGLVLATLNQHLHPDLTIFIGTAGGISKQLHIGDIVIANEAIDIDIYNMHNEIKNTPFASALLNPHTQKEIPIAYQAGAILETVSKIKNFGNLNIFIDRIGTSNHFPTPTFMFDTIKQLHIAAIDMESSVFYQASWLLGMKTLVIRAISNLIDDKGEDPNLHESKISLCADNLAAISLALINELSFTFI